MNKVTCAETVTIRTWLPKFSVLILFPNFPFFSFYMFRLVSFRFFSSNTLAYLDKEHDHLNTRGTKLGSNISQSHFQCNFVFLSFCFPPSCV